MWLINTFKPDLFISNTSESNWYAMGTAALTPHPIHPPVDTAAYLFEELLHTNDDHSLMDLLEGVHKTPIDLEAGFHALLILQKVPNTFARWLDHQLGVVRAMGGKLTLSRVVFCDAYSMQWHNIRKVWTHTLIEPRNLVAFRKGNLHLEPPTQTIFTAGLGPMRALKTAAVTRSSTEGTWALTANPSEDINVTRWINDAFPDWTSSTKAIP